MRNEKQIDNLKLGQSVSIPAENKKLRCGTETEISNDDLERLEAALFTKKEYRGPNGYKLVVGGEFPIKDKRSGKEMKFRVQAVVEDFILIGPAAKKGNLGTMGLLKMLWEIFK